MHIWQILAAGTGACLALSSCSPPTYDVITSLDNGVVVFNGRDSNGTTQYVAASKVSVMRGEAVLWEITYDRTQDCSYSPPGEHPFPLHYGEVPECWTQSHGPARLANGVVYTVRAYAGSRQGGGDFRLSAGSVEVFDTMSNF